MRLSRTHFPVTALGPGQRFGLWFQGCTIGCAGCVSVDTWNSKAGVESTADQVIEELASYPDVEGLTISGGEPLEQLDELVELLHAVRDVAPHLDVLVYTGYPEADLHSPRFDEVKSLVDAIIAGPFDSRTADSEHWRGSSNQSLLITSERGRDVILPWVTSPTVAHQLQVGMEEDRVWIIGIPRRGDLPRLARRLRAANIDVSEAAWQRSTVQ